MTLPDQPGGNSLDFGLLSDLFSISGDDGTIPALPDLVQPFVEAILKGRVQEDSGWLGASANFFFGLIPGIAFVPNLLMNIATSIIGLPFGVWPGTGPFGFIGEVPNILADMGNFFTNLVSFFGLNVDFNELIFDPLIAVYNFVVDMLLPTDLLAGLFDGFLDIINIPGLDASKITSGFFPIDMILGLPDMLLGFLTGDSPLDALNIFGVLPANLFGSVPIGSLANINPNLMPMGDFPIGSIAASGGEWTVDSATFSSGTGSAKVSGNGKLHALRGIRMAAQPNQEFELSVQTKHTSMAHSGSNPIQMGVMTYNGTALVGYTMVAARNPVDATMDWEELAGVYTVPASGVTAIQMRLVVGANVASGSIWFDAAAAHVTGLIQQDWVEGLVEQFNGILDMFGLGALADLIGLDADSVWANVIDLLIKPLDMLAPLIGGFLDVFDIPGLDASKIISGEFAMSMVTNLLSFLNIFAGGTGLVSSASNMVTNLLSMFDISGVGLLTGAPGSFDPIPLLESWIELVITPLDLLAPLVSGFIPVLNIPGLDSSKITTGNFAQSRITGLVSDIADRFRISGNNGAEDYFERLMGIFGGSTSPAATTASALALKFRDFTAAIIDDPVSMTNITDFGKRMVQGSEIIANFNPTAWDDHVQRIKDWWNAEDWVWW